MSVMKSLTIGSNTWDMPVTSVNSQTGDVVLSASDVGAAATSDLVIVAGTGTDSAKGVTADPNEGNIASGDGSFALGYHNHATGTASVSIGGKNSGKPDNEASGYGSVVLGVSSVASNTSAVAIGGENTASGKYSLALGFRTTASGQVGFTAGQQTQATSNMATAFGNYTIASGRAATAIGQANIEDTNPIDTTHGAGARKYIFTIGNGLNASNRSNALTVDWDGNMVLSGAVTATNIPAPPAGNGTYTLQCTVSGGVATYAWV